MVQQRRDFQSPEYKQWRLRVFKRDFFTCRMCARKEGIQAHHIRRWADFPQLRFVVNNGITLCGICHSNIKDKELEYAPLFIRMVGMKFKPDIDVFIRIKMLLRKKQ